jgi:hypothetical protein
MALSVRELREIAPGHARSSLRPDKLPWYKRLSPREMGAFLFRFVASVFATVSIVIMGWSLISEKPKGKGGEFRMSFDEDEGPWVSNHAPSWIGNTLDDILDGFRRGSSRDSTASGAQQTTEPFFKLTFTGTPTLYATGEGNLSVGKIGGSTGAKSTVSAPSQPSSVSRSVDRVAAIPSPSPGAKAGAARTEPAAPQRPTPAASPAEQRKVPEPSTKPPAPLVVATGKVGPEETRLIEAIARARSDFRIVGAVKPSFQRYLATNPAGIARADYERQVAELDALTRDAATERSSFNPDTDSFASPSLGVEREAAVRACFEKIEPIRNALIARKTIYVSPTVAAYVVLVDAPAKAADDLDVPLKTCLKSLNGDGTVSVLVNPPPSILTALGNRMRAVDGAVVYGPR